MKNKNIKKILLYISLIPYIILIFMCICFAVIGYGYNLGNTAYGFIAVGNFLGDVFSKIIKYLFFNPIALCIIILWIGYQIYYFISFKSNKKEKAEYSKESNVYTSKNINLKKILFFISINLFATSIVIEAFSCKIKLTCLPLIPNLLANSSCVICNSSIYSLK